MKRLLLSVQALLYVGVWVAVLSAFSLQGIAQTAADTNINNVASATYTDGTTSYSTVSNQVTVTVAKVAGLTITPDGQTNSTVVAGQTGVTMTFRVTNVGNFTDDVRFLASGASLRATTSGTAAPTITAATAGGTDILTNSSDVLKNLTQNGFVDVTVTLSIAAGASPADVITVYLGDATTGTNFDNITATNSANEVRTVSTGPAGAVKVTLGEASLSTITLISPRASR